MARGRRRRETKMGRLAVGSRGAHRDRRTRRRTERQGRRRERSDAALEESRAAETKTVSDRARGPQDEGRALDPASQAGVTKRGERSGIAARRTKRASDRRMADRRNEARPAIGDRGPRGQIERRIRPARTYFPDVGQYHWPQGLNGRVRDGIGCGPPGMSTGQRERSARSRVRRGVAAAGGSRVPRGTKEMGRGNRFAGDLRRSRGFRGARRVSAAYRGRSTDVSLGFSIGHPLGCRRKKKWSSRSAG